MRLKSLFDEGKYAPLHLPDVPLDPLKFRDERRYTDRLKDARSKTGLHDAVHAGIGKLHGDTVVSAVQDFDFMGGSLGTAAGEAVIASMRAALVRDAPFILFAASGGARMQEGILSLMQMPRTTVAVEELREAKLPYIVVLTNPTTGGVMASYAMLRDERELTREVLNRSRRRMTGAHVDEEARQVHSHAVVGGVLASETLRNHLRDSVRTERTQRPVFHQRAVPRLDLSVRSREHVGDLVFRARTDVDGHIGFALLEQQQHRVHAITHIDEITPRLQVADP